jgi:hypothetical protein
MNSSLPEWGELSEPHQECLRRAYRRLNERIAQRRLKQGDQDEQRERGTDRQSLAANAVDTTS